MKEHEPVVLTKSIPDHGLLAGDVGAIVHVYKQGQAFEVEFVAGNGTTVAVITLDRSAVRSISGSEILHVRKIPA
ncbi:MAG: DUF4926 domain-containing protein [Chloroflexi bacterium]|nr:DUF4926 domain-containing protein [Chloroflexota bacterium]